MTDSGANLIDSESDVGRDDDTKDIKRKLDEFLKNLGYNSPDELDTKVQSILTGSALSEYLAYKAKFVYFFLGSGLL